MSVFLGLSCSIVKRTTPPSVKGSLTGSGKSRPVLLTSQNVFVCEGQSCCFEFSAHSDMATILSSEAVPFFRCDLRSQYRSCAAPSRS
ncbi:hypothetical protein XENOCAPTIV_001593, partial [Xenoophorus captivus]